MPVIADKDAEALADELSMLGKIEKIQVCRGELGLHSRYGRTDR
jgi:hypothetical protein